MIFEPFFRGFRNCTKVRLESSSCSLAVRPDMLNMLNPSILTLEAPDPVLMKALQPKSFLLTLAVIVHLLDREVVPRASHLKLMAS